MGFAYRDPSIDIARRQGFVNGYASTDEMEDRASTFEYLMVRPDDLCSMSAKDPIVARKVRLLRQRVSARRGRRQARHERAVRPNVDESEEASKAEARSETTNCRRFTVDLVALHHSCYELTVSNSTPTLARCERLELC